MDGVDCLIVLMVVYEFIPLCSYMRWIIYNGQILTMLMSFRYTFLAIPN